MFGSRLVRMTGAIAVAAMLFWSLTATGDVTAASARPFKGMAAGVITNPLPFAGSGTIIATHLGKGAVEFSDVGFGLPAGAPGCFESDGGAQTFTAANGDTLEMEYESGIICFSADFSSATGEFTVSVTGGTGRFEDAYGVIKINAEADLGRGTWSSVLNGAISY